MNKTKPSLISRLKIHTLVLFYFRFVAIMTLIYGVQYWMLVIGLTDNQTRFDLMEPAWRIVSAILCVLLPVASLGIWGMQRWGFAIWIMAICVEVYAYFLMADYYGTRPSLLLFHACNITVLLIYMVICLFESQRKVHIHEA